ncbi:MAG: terminase small subunit [Dehalococcoidia bacterium]
MARPKKYTDKLISVMAKRLEKYIDETDVPIIKEFAHTNHISSQRLYEFEKTNEEFSEAIKRLRDKKEAQLEKLGLLNVINPTMAIFSLKQMGWKDRKEIAHEGELNVTSSPRDEINSRITGIAARTTTEENT